MSIGGPLLLERKMIKLNMQTYIENDLLESDVIVFLLNLLGLIF